MATAPEIWRPGSFTKNFSWGDRSNGLLRLHESIRLGFDGKLQDVPRSLFRERVKAAQLVDYIPTNFFLFNKTVQGEDFLVADELVFQALTAEHSPRFDKLGLFAFNFSYVGRWREAQTDQRRPALWAFHYIKDRVAKEFQWDTSFVNSNDIQRFVQSDERYRAKTARKLATNLNYLYSVGGLSDFRSDKVERWWVDALFLALDRLIEDRSLDGNDTGGAQYASILENSGFSVISGQRSLEKNLAEKHLISLYDACGARSRFSEEQVKERTELKIPDVEWFLANDSRPQGAVHPTNARILKSIPRACAMLARYAGFEIIDADVLASFDPDQFVREYTKRALENLRDAGIRPTMSAEDLMKLTRKK